jgi:hypothetical protein
MDLATQRLMSGAAGAGDDKVYVEDVFSTYLYDGNGSTQSINNGIDESGEGALTWIKMRSASGDYHHLYDTERGAGKTLFSNTDIAEQGSDTDRLSAFNSNGFSLGSNYRVNGSGSTFVSWTFRKSPGFFDCMLYSGNSETPFNLSHDLGVVPALIILKSRTYGNKWYVWMKGQSTNNQLKLASDAEQGTDSSYRVGENATATHIRIPTGSEVNYSGNNVAYVFADGDQSDAQIFGKTGDQQLTKSGTYTGNGNANGPEVNLGWEPQWLLVKEIDGTGNWQIVDSMRGISSDLNDTQLRPNTTQADNTRSLLDLTPTGFKLTTASNTYWNENGKTYAYFAIRRSDGYVGKPKTATEVFNVVNDTNTTPRNQVGFPVDMALLKHSTLPETTFLTGRLLHGAPGKILQTANSNAASNSSLAAFDFQNGWVKNANNMANYRSWNWKRHAGFDMMVYSITEGGGTHTQNHGLGRVPEMIWMKDLDNSDGWIVYHKGLNGGTNPKDYYIQLQGDGTESNLNNFWGTSASDINATSFYINQNFRYTGHHMALLFASTDVSKVGYYTGDGTDDGSKEINLGFSLRYLLLKSSNNAGDWYQYDSLTGLSASGNSTYFQLNDTDAPASGIKSITTTSTGFKVWSQGNSFNANGTKIIYYAHA